MSSSPRRHSTSNRRWTTCVALISLIALAAPCAAQLNQPLNDDGWILAAAHAPGLHDSIWRTDLWIYVDTYGAGRVTLRFCESGADGSLAEEFVVDSSDGQRVLFFEDVVDHFLGVGDGSWIGSIHYIGSQDVQVWARVYSISADGSRSYGQLVEGIPTAHMSPDDDPWDSDDHQWLYAMKHTSDGRYRVNIGIVNPTSTLSTYIVEIWDATSDDMATGGEDVFVDIPPYSMLQLGDPFADADGGDWSSCQVRVICLTEGGGTFAYASVVDNATNDAFFVRGVKDYEQSEMPGLNCTGHRDGWVLAAAHAPGLHGSIWRTDLWIRAKPRQGRPITLYLNESGTDGTQSQAYEIEMTDAKVYYIEDVVEHFLDLDGDSWVGAIHYQADTHLQVWARVYSISADGTESYGQLIEGIPTDDASPAPPDRTSTNDYQWMMAARHTADERYRVNMGMVNPSPVDTQFLVNMYGGDGDELEESVGPVAVPAYSMVQVGDVFATVDGGDWSDKIIRVEPTTAGSLGFAYLSVVDNATNDAYFVRGIKLWSYPAR